MKRGTFEWMDGGEAMRKKKRREILLSSRRKFCLLSVSTHRKYKYCRGERAFLVTDVFSVELTAKACPIPASTNCTVNWK